MKVTISKYIQIQDAQKAKQIKREFAQNPSESCFDESDMKRAAAIYLGESVSDIKGIYEIEAEVSYHDRKGLTDEIVGNGCYFDIYIKFFAVGSEHCGYVSFYLSDFWEADGENYDYLKSLAYVNLYTRDKK